MIYITTKWFLAMSYVLMFLCISIYLCQLSQLIVNVGFLAFAKEKDSVWVSSIQENFHKHKFYFINVLILLYPNF